MWFDLDAFVSTVSNDVSPVAEVEADSGDDHEDEDGDETNDHAYKETPDTGLLGVNQVQVPASSWQHGSQICFATFILSKIAKLLMSRPPLKLEKNMQKFRILKFF